MSTYVKLNDGRVMVVWSDNTDEKTMHGYPMDREFDWDVEWDTCEMWNYDDIVQKYTNRWKVLDQLVKYIVLGFHIGRYDDHRQSKGYTL